jgi:hypothetical protein
LNEFDLRRLVREVMDSSTLADPHAIADEVYQRIPKSMIAVALQVTLKAFVRQVVSESRHRMSPSRVPVPNATVGGSGFSAKRAGIAEWWQRALRDRVEVGGSGKREWKMLGECTADDLERAAAFREQQAERNKSVARMYRAWARTLNERGVQQMRELPPEVLQQNLAGKVA